VTGDPTGAAAAATPGATTATQPTANLVGCTPKQEDTAALMVRLGKLYRVEDVQLNESTQESLGADASDQASFDGCGSYYKYDLTVTFSATPPAREAPRGAVRVPASLGGGS
jgi:hypothetical protein